MGDGYSRVGSPASDQSYWGRSEKMMAVRNEFDGHGVALRVIPRALVMTKG
jgi:hypothetical protein